MNNLPEHIEFVKQQLQHYERMARKSKSDEGRLKLYNDIAGKLEKLRTDLHDALLSADEPGSGDISPSKPAPAPMGASLSKLPPGFFANPLNLTPSDFVGLPDVVIRQLNITPSDMLEVTIIELINAAGGMLALDKLIAGLYHITGEVHPRNQLTSRLYRMTKKNLIFAVPKKKGIYTTIEPAEPDALGAMVLDDAPLDWLIEIERGITWEEYLAIAHTARYSKEKAHN